MNISKLLNNNYIKVLIGLFLTILNTRTLRQL